MMQGVGTYLDSLGNSYTGQFYQDSKKGIGKILTKFGGTTYGIWIDG